MISAVPLPRWTSQSSTNTRSNPCSAIADSAAIAMLLNRQNPIARAWSAWCPAGRRPLKPRSSPPYSSRSTIRQAPPAACSAARKNASPTNVSSSIGPPPAAAKPTDFLDVGLAVDPLERRVGHYRRVEDVKSQPVERRHPRVRSRRSALECRDAQPGARWDRARAKRGDEHRHPSTRSRRNTRMLVVIVSALPELGEEAGDLRILTELG